MPQLKALRGSIGIYGRVKANGIVEVEEKDVENLLKTKRFVRASAGDIAAAEEAQKAFLAVDMTGTAPGFAAVAKADASDRLQVMIDSGTITEGKAKELLALQIELSADEVKAAVRHEIEKHRQDLEAKSLDLADREKTLADRENAHADAVSAHGAEVQRVAALAADLEKREMALAVAQVQNDAGLADSANAAETAPAAESKADPKAKAAK